MCLGVEVVVQKTLQEATAHDQAFTTKAAQDLDLWTSALQPLFDTDIISEADMEARQAHARETGQVVSDQILGQSRQAIQSHLLDGGPVQVGGGTMCSHLGESYQAGCGDIGSAHAGRPGGCIPGCLVPAHVHTAARDHLYGGHSSWGSRTPWGPQLGRTGIHDPVICPSDSGTGFSKWLKPHQYRCLHRCSNVTTGSAN